MGQRALGTTSSGTDATPHRTLLLGPSTTSLLAHGDQAEEQVSLLLLQIGSCSRTGPCLIQLRL